MSDVPTYWSLKKATATKASLRSSGKIHYRVLTDSNQQQLFITITGNEAGGYYSQEIIALSKIEQCLADLTPNTPFPTRQLRPAFVGRSANNAGFLVAILRAENLLTCVDEAACKNAILPGWETWQAALLAMPGEPYEPPQTLPVLSKVVSANVKKETSSSKKQEAPHAAR